MKFKRVIFCLFIQCCFLSSQRSGLAGEIPVREYSDYFSPPESFFSPFGVKSKPKDSVLRAAEIDMKQRTSLPMKFFGAIRRGHGKEQKLFYIFGPKPYCPGINQDEFWIYVTSGKSRIDALFKYSRVLNQSLIPLYVDRVPLPRCNPELSTKLIRAPLFKNVALELIEASSVYAKCHLNQEIVYWGAKAIKTESGRLIALNFEDTKGTDAPITFVADQNRNKVISFEPYNRKNTGH